MIFEGPPNVCIRFASALSSDLAVSCFQAILGVPDIAPSWNIKLGHLARVVRHVAGEPQRSLDALYWGLVPHYVKSGRQRNKIVTIAADRVTISRTTKIAFTQQRCLVPITAFYELGDRPHALKSTTCTMLAVAAVWDSWQHPTTGKPHHGFALITRPNLKTDDPVVQAPPFIIRPEHWDVWLDAKDTSARKLLANPVDEPWHRWPISRRILNANADGSFLLATFSNPQNAGVDASSVEALEEVSRTEWVA